MREDLQRKDQILVRQAYLEEKILRKVIWSYYSIQNWRKVRPWWSRSF